MKHFHSYVFSFQKNVLGQGLHAGYATVVSSDYNKTCYFHFLNVSRLWWVDLLYDDTTVTSPASVCITWKNTTALANHESYIYYSRCNTRAQSLDGDSSVAVDCSAKCAVNSLDRNRAATLVSVESEIPTAAFSASYHSYVTLIDHSEVSIAGFLVKRTGLGW